MFRRRPPIFTANCMKNCGRTVPNPTSCWQASRGSGQYVATYMTYGIRHPGWWGEGEIKSYIDGDRELATIMVIQSDGVAQY